MVEECPHIINIKSRLSNIFYRAISRFDFVYESSKDPKINA